MIHPAEIEDAIQKQLLAKLKTATGLVHSVVLFAGTVEELDQAIATGQMPAVFVFYAGREQQPLNETGSLRLRTASFDVWVVHNTLRSAVDRKITTGGLYDILEAAEAALDGQTLQMQIQPLRLTSELPLGLDRTERRLIWTQTYTTDYYG